MWALFLPLFQAGIPRADCRVLADSVADLAASAPAQAVVTARTVASRCDSDFDALLRAGRALNRATDFRGAMAQVAVRDAAQSLLNRAIALRPRSAEAWFEYAIITRKRQGSMFDAQRFAGRSLRLLQQAPESVPPAVAAEIWLQHARDLQDGVDRMRWLKDGRNVPVTTVSCSELGTFCENFVRPQAFNEKLRDAATVYPELDFLRERLLAAYDSAWRFDSSNVAILAGRAREYALGEEWERLAAFARTAANRGRDPARFRTVEALAHVRMGHDLTADSVFRAAIPLLADSLRRWFERPPPGHDTIPDFWARTRPLWLAPFNELQLEYWTRVAYALLALTDHEAAVLGPETPQGEALLRYGFPHHVSQIPRDASAILTRAQLSAVLQVFDCIPTDLRGQNDIRPDCSTAGAEAPANADFSAGRWIFWTYAADRPSLIFEIRTGQRVPRYEWNGAAERYATELRRRSPLDFESRLAPHLVSLLAQLTRFRSPDRYGTSVLIHAAAPGQSMGAPTNDSIETGVFVFADRSGYPLVARHVERRAIAVDLALSYAFALPQGRYAYSVEAWSPATGTAVIARDSLLAPAWPPDSLALSDLLVAERVEPAHTHVVRWSDLSIAPLPLLAVGPGAIVALVWESYGVQPGREGVAGYDITLEVRDDNARSLPLRLLDRVGLARSPREPAVRLSWHAERPAGEVLLDYATVQLPPDATGRLRLVVVVRDATSGQEATRERTITVQRTW